MEKQDLIRALNRGIVIRCETIGQFVDVLRVAKQCGGRWLNGNEIVYLDSDLSSQEKCITRLHVSTDFVLSYVSAMCFHFGAYPTVEYAKFKTDRGTIDVKDVDKK